MVRRFKSLFRSNTTASIFNNADYNYQDDNVTYSEVIDLLEDNQNIIASSLTVSGSTTLAILNLGTTSTPSTSTQLGYNAVATGSGSPSFNALANTAVNIASITIPAGVYRVDGIVYMSASVSTMTNNYVYAVLSTSNTSVSSPSDAITSNFWIGATTANRMVWCSVDCMYTFSTPTTVYLNSYWVGSFTSGTYDGALSVIRYVRMG